jgi:hypothetical protein
MLKSIVGDQNPSIRPAALLAVTRPLPPSDAAPILSVGLKDTIARFETVPFMAWRGVCRPRPDDGVRMIFHGDERDQFGFPMHALLPWGARTSGVLLHGTGTETTDELTCVNNHRPSIFLASPLRSTWLLAAHSGKLVVGSKDTSK